MRYCFFLTLLIFLFPLILPIYAQSSSNNPNYLNIPKSEYSKAKVQKILDAGKKKIGNAENLYQKVQLLILDGSEKNETITVEHGGIFTISEEQKVKPADTVIVSKTITNGQTQYRIADIYRLSNLFYILAGFFTLVVITAGHKGFGSFLGMIISLAVIVFFIIPQILNGANPLLISLIGSFLIMVTTIYLAHGFTQQTSIAIVATLVSLMLTIILSIVFVNMASLSGLGSEDIFSLAQGFQGKINFQGLLLGGIIIGTLGVLDDVTTTQTATIFSLAEANHKLSMRELFYRGMNIGREHIASLVNTLVLAYAGASIGIFIFLILTVQQQNQPLWVILNSELIMEEVIRTLVGSSSLILAVPITTLLASFFARYSLKIK